MKFKHTAIILSGGKNKRFYNKNKGFSKIGTLRMIDRIYIILKKLFKNIIIISNNPIKYTYVNTHIITDYHKYRSSINGVHAGLFASPSEYSFFVACDTPFINPALITLLINNIQYNDDIVVPKTTSGVEPLFAIYSKKCLNPIRNQIKKGDYKIKNLFNKVHTKIVHENKIKNMDKNMISFININNLNELSKAKKYFIRKTITYHKNYNRLHQNII